MYFNWITFYTKVKWFYIFTIALLVWWVYPPFLGCAALLLAQPHHHVIFVVLPPTFSAFCSECQVCLWCCWWCHAIPSSCRAELQSTLNVRFVTLWAAYETERLFSPVTKSVNILTYRHEWFLWSIIYRVRWRLTFLTNIGNLSLIKNYIVDSGVNFNKAENFQSHRLPKEWQTL